MVKENQSARLARWQIRSRTEQLPTLKIDLQLSSLCTGSLLAMILVEPVATYDFSIASGKSHTRSGIPPATDWIFGLPLLNLALVGFGAASLITNSIPFLDLIPHCGGC